MYHHHTMMERPDLLTKSYSLETGLSKIRVWKMRTENLGLASYHICVVQALTGSQKRVYVERCQVMAETANTDPEVVKLAASGGSIQ